MGSITPFLIWLICIGIAAIMVGLFIQKSENEGFADVSISSSPPVSGTKATQSNITITTCPTGSASYITSKGNTNCCDGDLVNNVCNGTDLCSLSESVPGGLQSCAEWITKEWVTRSKKFCSPSLPFYFGTLSRTPGTEGCSSSLSTSDGSAPEDTRQPQCKIYTNMTDELSNTDSCFNATARDTMKCPQDNATKAMISYGKSTPVILTCNYIPKDGSTNGMPTSCMDAPRAVQYIKSLTWIPVDRINTVVDDINSMRNASFCNYVKNIGTGYKISGDGLPSTEVVKVLPVTNGPYQGDGNNMILLAQYGNSIVFAHIDKNAAVMNGRTGKIIPGKLSNYTLVKYDDLWKMLSSLNAGSNVRLEKDLTNMSVTKV
jgi:hypothetical protein